MSDKYFLSGYLSEKYNLCVEIFSNKHTLVFNNNGVYFTLVQEYQNEYSLSFENMLGYYIYFEYDVDTVQIKYINITFDKEVVEKYEDVKYFNVFEGIVRDIISCANSKGVFI